MKQTANYGLNQWDEEDRILREDFNGDNLRTDTAIKTLEEKPHGEFLLGGTVDTQVLQVDMDVSGVDWNRYLFLMLQIELQGKAQLYLRTDKTVSGNTQTVTVNGFSTSEMRDWLMYIRGTGPFHAILPTFYDDTRPFCVAQFGQRASFGACQVPLREISALSFISYSEEYPIFEGSMFRLWGVR